MGELLTLVSGASMMQFWEGSFVLGWETQVHKEPRVFTFTHSYTQSSHTHTPSFTTLRRPSFSPNMPGICTDHKVTGL